MPAVLSDQIVLNIFSNAAQAAYFAPFHQRPPEAIYRPLKSHGNHQTSTAKINSSEQFSTPPLFAPSFNNNENIYASILQQQRLEISQLVLKIKSFVCNPAAPNDIDSISETIDNAYEVIVKFGPGALDFTFIDTPTNLNGEHLAALLRVTHAYKKQIHGWDNALLLNIKALEIAQLDINDALAGLIQG